MKYYLRKTTDDVLEFDVLNEGRIIGLIFSLVGFTFLVSGLLMLISGFEEEGFEPLDQLLTGAGGMFLPVGFLASRASRQTPRCIRFDNKSAQFIISQDKNFKETVALPYDRIREFVCRRTGAVSASSDIMQGIYQVLMITTDLQVWNLGEFRTGDKAEAHRNYLTKMIERDKPSQAITPTVSRQVVLEKSGHSAVIHWKSNEGTVRFLGAIILASMLLVVDFIHRQGGFPEAVYFLTSGLIALIIVALLVFTFRAWTQVCRLEIGEGKFCFSKKRGLTVTLVREMDVKHIRAVGVNFENNDPSSGILVVGQEMFNTLSNIDSRNLTIGGVFRRFRKSIDAFVLPAVGWKTIDRIRLSEMVRALIKAHEGNCLV